MCKQNNAMYNQNANFRDENFRNEKEIEMATTTFHPGTMFKAVALALLIIVLVSFIWSWIKSRGYCLRNNNSALRQDMQTSVAWGRHAVDAVQYVQPVHQVHPAQMILPAGQAANAQGPAQAAGIPAPVMPILPNMNRN